MPASRALKVLGISKIKEGQAHCGTLSKEIQYEWYVDAWVVIIIMITEIIAVPSILIIIGKIVVIEIVMIKVIVIKNNDNDNNYENDINDNNTSP